MKLTIDLPFARVEGSHFEVNAVRSILTYCVKDADPVTLFDERNQSFHSGLAGHVTRQLILRHVEVEIDDRIGESRRVHADVPADLLTGRTLRDYQIRILEKAIYRGAGIGIVPTAGGKSVLMAGTARLCPTPSLVVTNGKSSVHQTARRFQELGLKDVGVVVDGKHEYDHEFVIGTNLSLFADAQRDKYRAAFESFRTLQLNECQHTAAKTYFGVAEACVNAVNRFAWSGTPFQTRDQSDVRDAAVLAAVGDVFVEIPARYLIAQDWIAEPLIFLAPVANRRISFNVTNWHKVAKEGVYENHVYNHIVASIAYRLVQSGRRVLVATDRVSHGYHLLDRLKSLGVSSVFFCGEGEKSTDPSYEPDMERDFEQALERFQVIVGSKILNEDIDIPAIDAAIIASSGRSAIELKQKLGRAMRGNADRTPKQSIIIDFVNECHVFLRAQALARIKEVYWPEGYRCFPIDCLDAYLREGVLPVDA